MRRFKPQRCVRLTGEVMGYGILDRQPANTAAPGRVTVMRTAIRDYTENEAQQVCDWLNGEDWPLPTTHAYWGKR